MEILRKKLTVGEVEGDHAVREEEGEKDREVSDEEGEAKVERW